MLKTLMVRSLLLVALCNLLASSLAAQTAGVPQAKNDNPAFSDFNCNEFVVVVSGSAGRVADVSCSHGDQLFLLPASGNIAPGKPAVLFFKQSAIHGPDCTIRLKRGKSKTAVLSVQQNFCGLEAGTVTASVTSGQATFNAKAEGSYNDNLPGAAWFTVNF